MRSWSESLLSLLSLLTLLISWWFRGWWYFGGAHRMKHRRFPSRFMISNGCLSARPPKDQSESCCTALLLRFMVGFIKLTMASPPNRGATQKKVRDAAVQRTSWPAWPAWPAGHGRNLGKLRNCWFILGNGHQCIHRDSHDGMYHHTSSAAIPRVASRPTAATSEWEHQNKLCGGSMSSSHFCWNI